MESNFTCNPGPTLLTNVGIKSCISEMVVCEVPEARQSVNDKTNDSDEVYFNDCTVYTQVEIS